MEAERAEYPLCLHFVTLSGTPVMHGFPGSFFVSLASSSTTPHTKSLHLGKTTPHVPLYIGFS